MLWPTKSDQGLFKRHSNFRNQHQVLALWFSARAVFDVCLQFERREFLLCFFLFQHDRFISELVEFPSSVVICL